MAEAVRIVAEQGGGALTVRRVAEAAGCSTIGIYSHFGDKAGLLEAVVLDGFADFGAALAAAETGGTALERLLASARAYRAWALANRTRYLIMLTPHVAGFTPRAAVTERTAAVFEAHRARVAQAIAERSLIDADAEALARHLWALVHGQVLLELMLTPPPAATGAAAFDAALDWALAGIAVG